MRKWLITISCVGMLLLLPICAFAHSGRTDGSGGHHDGDDYHYHHGYPAHDHWDMDGDGDVDCPYQFDDKTGQNSGGAGNSGSDQGSSQNRGHGNSAATGGSTVSNSIHPLFWVVAGILLIWAIYRLAQIVCKEIKKILAIRASNRKVLQLLGRENVRIPRGVALLPDGTPTRGLTDFDRLYGDYTVYASPKGTRFHASRRCCPQGNPEHLFEIQKRLSPCRNCASGPQYIGGIPNWYSELTKSGVNHSDTKE